MVGSLSRSTRSAPELVRVLLVDSHDLVHWGFRSVLSREPWVEHLATARNAAEAIALARRYRPHVAVISGDLVNEAAADVCRKVRAQSPSTRVLLTSSARVSEPQAKTVGAAGVVPKTWRAEDIAGAVRTVALGQSFFSPDLEKPSELLGPRERAVLEMIGQGATNREVARKLDISPHTVKDHVSALYRKLDARNRAEAVVRAQRLGLL